jgi:aryl-alcohol dehydrogenase-like predicted oxidoreductase
VIVIPSARTVEHALSSITASGLTLSETDLAAITAAEFSRA